MRAQTDFLLLSYRQRWRILSHLQVSMSLPPTTFNDLAAKISKIFLKFHPFYVNVARKLLAFSKLCKRSSEELRKYNVRICFHYRLTSFRIYFYVSLLFTVKRNSMVVRLNSGLSRTNITATAMHIDSKDIFMAPHHLNSIVPCCIT